MPCYSLKSGMIITFSFPVLLALAYALPPAKPVFIAQSGASALLLRFSKLFLERLPKEGGCGRARSRWLAAASLSSFLWHQSLIDHGHSTTTTRDDRSSCPCM
jgi:hypothetical protein